MILSVRNFPTSIPSLIQLGTAIILLFCIAEIISHRVPSPNSPSLLSLFVQGTATNVGTLEFNDLITSNKISLADFLSAERYPIQVLATNESGTDQISRSRPHTEIMKATNRTNALLSYENPINEISIAYPSNWTKYESQKNITFISPSENKTDSFQEKLIIDIFPTSNIPLDERVSLEIHKLRENVTNFKLLDSVRYDGPLGIGQYKITYMFGNESELNYKAMQRWTAPGGKTYSIKYIAQSEDYDNYLPTIEQMIDSINIKTEKPVPIDKRKVPELAISVDPYDIAVDPITNKLYISNMRFHTVSVINGSTDKPIAEIKVQNFPVAIALDSEMNKVYVANSHSNTVSVIDGSTFEVISNVKVGKKPVDIEIDSTEEGVDSLAFVANSDSNTISVLEATNDTLIDNISVGSEPGSLAIDPVINRLYVANSDSNTISVIDYYIGKGGTFNNKKVVEDIKVGNYPSSIVLDPEANNKLYVANSDSNTVSIIDTSALELRPNDIQVGNNPYSIVAHKNKVYVSNYGSNTVSIIDSNNNSVLNEISVGSFPVILTANPITDLIYVTNLGSRSISEIYNDRLVSGITYNINPPNSGYLECNKKRIADDEYVRYHINEKVSCKASGGLNSVFESWDGDFTSTFNSTATDELAFNPFKYGKLNANFRVLQVLELPQEFFGQLYSGIMIPVITSVIGGLFIPSTIRWLNGKRQRGYLKRCMTTINKIYETPPQNSENYLERSEAMKRKTDELLTDGKISEEQYGILNDKISEYERRK
jgi:YVTN family beta-propeller protein